MRTCKASVPVAIKARIWCSGIRSMRPFVKVRRSSLCRGAIRASAASSRFRQVLLLVSLVLAAGQISRTCATPEVELYTFEVVGEMPHDPTSFTQGLQFDQLCETSKDSCQEIVWESTGLNGESKVRAVEIESGKVLREVRLDRKWFGEGLTRLGEQLYQLTWLTPSVLVYDINLKQVEEVRTPLKDGWGITTDGSSLIVSDGSHKLFWLDPATMALQQQVEVMDGSFPVNNLNELEMVEGEVWANVWQTECIARIDPKTGRVNGWVVLNGLRSALLARGIRQPHTMDVLNGIAYDSFSGRVFVTGKLWPRMYEIKAVRMTAQQRRNTQLSSCRTGPNQFHALM